MEKLVSDFDDLRYKHSEMQKEMSESKLQAEVLKSVNDSLTAEKDHLTLELKETRDLEKSYETKCGELIKQLNEVESDYQRVRKTMTGHEELRKEREERIERLKVELEELREKHDRLEIEHGTLVINYEKVSDQLDSATKELDETTEKLHVTNKVRHENEIKLGEEIEKSRGLQDLIKIKEDTLVKRATEIEELDKKVLDFERLNETLEIKKLGVERALEL